MKKSVLFVDDEINILDGFRRVLHSQRETWEMHFANSSAEALETMEKQPVDIIIADIAMPALNGVQLLEKVSERHPGTIRMILSGSAESDLIMKSLAVTHQYISKPCNPEILKAVIADAIQSKKFLQNDNLKDLIAKVGALPSIPIFFREISEELHSPDASINKVAALISRDPSMAAKILQLANSAFFGRRRSVSQIAEAVTYLGMDRVAQLLLAIHAFGEFRPAESVSFSIEDLWTHSNSTALRAKEIAEVQNAHGGAADDAFTAGLLHDIGKLVFASRLPVEYEGTILRAIRNKVPLWIAESDCFSATHAEVGAYLLDIWGLPKPVVDAIAFHHTPLAKTGNGFTPLSAVHAADTLENLTERKSIH